MCTPGVCSLINVKACRHLIQIPQPKNGRSRQDQQQQPCRPARGPGRARTKPLFLSFRGLMMASRLSIPLLSVRLNEEYLGDHDPLGAGLTSAEHALNLPDFAETYDIHDEGDLAGSGVKP